MKNKSNLILLTAFAVLMAGCGAKSDMKRAKKLEAKGKFDEAWDGFQRLAADHPQSPLAPEALFRAGLMAQRRLGDCYMAGSFYDRVIEMYPQSAPWARAAALQKQNCPDYFPLIAGTEWIEGDSETQGKNARIQTVCKALEGSDSLPSEAGILVKTYFAGDKKSSGLELFYKKTPEELLEFRNREDAVGKVLLQWPISVNTEWKTRPSDVTFLYKIVSLDEKVRVVAGEFEHCLKVQSGVSGIVGASTNEYYAPGVGRVLTTISTKGNENRVTELLSYKPGEWTLP
jgi:hypothetical protein